MVPVTRPIRLEDRVPGVTAVEHWLNRFVDLTGCISDLAALALIYRGKWNDTMVKGILDGRSSSWPAFPAEATIAASQEVSRSKSAAFIPASGDGSISSRQSDAKSPEQLQRAGFFAEACKSVPADLASSALKKAAFQSAGNITPVSREPGFSKTFAELRAGMPSVPQVSHPARPLETSTPSGMEADVASHLGTPPGETGQPADLGSGRYRSETGGQGEMVSLEPVVVIRGKTEREAEPLALRFDVSSVPSSGSSERDSPPSSARRRSYRKSTSKNYDVYRTFTAGMEIPDRNDLQAAKRWLTKSIDLISQDNDPERKKEIFNFLTEICKLKGYSLTLEEKN